LKFLKLFFQVFRCDFGKRLKAATGVVVLCLWHIAGGKKNVNPKLIGSGFRRGINDDEQLT